MKPKPNQKNAGSTCQVAISSMKNGKWLDPTRQLCRNITLVC